MLEPTGRLGIKVRRADGQLQTEVTRPAPIPLDVLLKGKSPDEVAHVVPLVFNVCAAAQESASRSALDLPVNTQLSDRLKLETLREHLLKLCVIWPSKLGLDVDMQTVAQAKSAIAEPSSALTLSRAIFGPEDRLPTDWSAFEHWVQARETVPARMLAHLIEHWDADWGRADLPLLDINADVDWATATQHGGAVENGPAGRVADNPLMSDIAEHLGQGLIWRMSTRLVVIDQLLNGTLPETEVKGCADAARGTMMVRAHVGLDGVERYERLTPTDFALATDGALERALRSLPKDDISPLEQITKLVVDSIDPCVPVTLEVSHA